MNLKLGSKNGKNNRRLFFLNRKKKLYLEEIEKDEKMKKDEKTKQKNKDNIISISDIQKRKKDDGIKIVDTNYRGVRRRRKTVGKNKIDPSPIPQEEIVKDEKNVKDNEEEKIILEKEIIKNELRKVSSDKEKEKLDININQEEKREFSIKSDTKDIHTTPVSKTENNCLEMNEGKVKQQENINPIIRTDSRHRKTQEIINGKDYIERQIIKILDQQIDENRFKLKKMDSELYAIQNEIDNLEKEEDVLALEKEIERLIEKINIIKRQIESIQKTVEFDFPVLEPDNYLIYLIDEYKDTVKNKHALSDKLEQNKEFKSIIDKIIEIEEKQELLLERTKERKDKLKLDDEQVEKLNNDIINIDDMKKRIEKMLSEQNNLLNEIKIKLDKTVNITEKVNYVTKTVNHSLFELFLLMSILKRNLSIKNNVIAAVSAKIALDMILKMTTPTTEETVTKVSDIKDYESLINNCLNDTSRLENIMDENLDNISSIRYTFEHEYKECSYLDSYKEALDKLTTLENEMKERKNDVIKIRKETELQLEKNNAKVKKYGSMAA